MCLACSRKLSPKSYNLNGAVIYLFSFLANCLYTDKRNMIKKLVAILYQTLIFMETNFIKIYGRRKS